VNIMLTTTASQLPGKIQRRGMLTVEVVMAIGVLVFLAFVFYFLGQAAGSGFFHMVSVFVGWSY